MKTPSEISLEGREEFDEKHAQNHWTNTREWIQSHILSREVKILESVIDMIENVSGADDGGAVNFVKFALKEQIQEEIKKIQQ